MPASNKAKVFDMKDAKKKPAAKKPAPKAGFYPKVKSTKKNGLGGYK